MLIVKTEQSFQNLKIQNKTSLKNIPKYSGELKTELFAKC